MFPPPVYDIATRRPHYIEELQQVCLSVKEKNCGINGRVVLFTGVVLALFWEKSKYGGPLHPRELPNTTG